MLPTTFQLLVPSPVLGPGGEENWASYAAAVTMEELEAHAQQQRIPRWCIAIVAPVKAFPPAGTTSVFTPVDQVQGGEKGH